MTWVGPLTAGVIVTFTSWRAILWLQTAMAGLGLVLSWVTIEDNESDRGVWRTAPTRDMLGFFSPMPVLRMMRYPDVSMAVSSPPLSDMGLLGLRNDSISLPDF